MGEGSCWDRLTPEEPFSFRWYTTQRGGEYIHLYLWILKDLSWTQDWYYVGNITGVIAVLWGTFMLSRAYRCHNRNEIATGSSQLLWLIANLWWMSGELHDWQYRKDVGEPLLYPVHTIQCGYILKASLAIMFVYYLFLRPLNIAAPSLESLEPYDETALEPRCPSFFTSWREYENMHILWWLATDYAWNTINPYSWVISGVPTILIAGDFVVSSFNVRRLVVSHYHYVAQFLWFLANLIWAYGELFDPLHDYPYSLFAKDPEARRTCRWWSSWCLVCAYIPIVCLHVVWMVRTPRMFRDDPEMAIYRFRNAYGYGYTPILPHVRIVPVAATSTDSLSSASGFDSMAKNSYPLYPVVRATTVPVPPSSSMPAKPNYGSMLS